MKYELSEKMIGRFKRNSTFLEEIGLNEVIRLFYRSICPAIILKTAGNICTIRRCGSLDM